MIPQNTTVSSYTHSHIFVLQNIIINFCLLEVFLVKLQRKKTRRQDVYYASRKQEISPYLYSTARTLVKNMHFYTYAYIYIYVIDEWWHLPTFSYFMRASSIYVQPTIHLRKNLWFIEHIQRWQCRLLLNPLQICEKSPKISLVEKFAINHQLRVMSPTELF